MVHQWRRREKGDEENWRCAGVSIAVTPVALTVVAPALGLAPDSCLKIHLGAGITSVGISMAANTTV